MNQLRILLGTPSPDSLNIVTNGDFKANADNWNISPSGSSYWLNGKLTLSAGTATITQTGLTTTTGYTYKLRYFLYASEAGTLTASFNNQVNTASTTGWKEYTITTTAATSTLTFTKDSTLEGYIDNVSIIRYGGYNPYSWEEVDITNDDDFGLNLARQNVDTIGQRYVTYSPTLTLPGTSNNDKIFNNLFDLSVVDTSKYLNQRIPALVYYGDIEILNGYAELTQVAINQASNDSKYSITLSDGLRAFADILSDKKIVGNTDLADDIDFSEYNQTFSINNILNSWSTNLGATASTVSFGSGIYYPLLEVYGNTAQDAFEWTQFRPAIYTKELFDKIVSGAGFTYTSTFLNSANFKQLTHPFTGVIEEEADELKKLECKVGLTADFNDTQSNGRITALAYQQNTVPNFGGKYNGVITFLMRQTAGQTGYMTDESSYDFSDVGSHFGPVNLANIGNFHQGDTYGYTVTKNGKYVFTFGTEYLIKVLDTTIAAVNYTALASCKTILTVNLRCRRGNADWVIATNKGSIKPISGTYFNPNNISPLAVANTFGPSVTTIAGMANEDDFQIGDIIYPEFILDAREFQFTVAGAGQGPNINRFNCSVELLRQTQATNVIAPGTYFSVQAKNSDLLYLGDYVDVNKFLPKEVNQLDYFTDIINLFNLSVDTDPLNPKHLIIDLRENYLAAGTQKDWSLLLDRGQDVIIERVPTLVNKNVKFTYQEDTDDLNKKYQDYWTEGYGDYTVYNEEPTNDDYDVELKVFAPTPCALIPNSNIVIGQIYETSAGKSTPKAHKMRVLYRNDIIINANSNITLTTNKISQNNVIKITDRFATSNQVTTIPSWITTATQFDEPYLPVYDLNWGYSKEYYQPWYTNPAIPPYNNLYNTYWKDWIDSIIDPDSKLITGYFNLNEKELYDLRFNDQINIDGNYYLVNTINDWNPNRLTEVQLIKVLDSKIPNSSSGKTNATLVLINNLSNIGQNIKTKGPFSSVASSMPSTLTNQYSIPAVTISGATSGDSISNYTAITETVEMAKPTVIAQGSLGYNTGNDNSINTKNFFVSGWNNRINISRNVIVNGTDNVVNGMNTNVTLLTSNALVQRGVDDVAIVGTSPSGVTITQSNSTILAGGNILSTTPIQTIIHIVDGRPTTIYNRLKNIHIIDGKRRTSSHTLGGDDDTTHILDGKGGQTNTYTDVQ